MAFLPYTIGADIVTQKQNLPEWKVPHKVKQASVLVPTFEGREEHHIIGGDVTESGEYTYAVDLED